MNTVVHTPADRPVSGLRAFPIPSLASSLAELARQAAAAADERAQALGEQAAADPPDWAIDLFGDVPDDPQERQQWVDGAAAVASYRELTGHDDAEQAIGEAPPAHNAEWRASWRHAPRPPGYDRTEVADRQATDGELHADRMAGQRAEPWAPPDVAEELREMQGAVSAWEQQADRETDPEQAASYAGLASLVQDREAELDAEQQQRIEWDTEHAAGQEAARRAAGELARRGIIEPEQPSRNLRRPAPNWAAAPLRPGLGGSAASPRRTCRWTTTSRTPTWRSSGPSVSGGTEAGLAEPEIDEPELGL